MTADITKSMVEIAIDKAIRDIERDPDRSIRNFVDLGGAFTKGRFQSHLFKAVQTLLKNRQSAYYELGRRIITNIDHRTVKGFGLNLGYNAFTTGAKKIRELEAAEGFNIPWTLIFSYDKAGQMTIDQIDRAITQGKALGIYAYQFFVTAGRAAELTALARGHGDCAFVLYFFEDTAHSLSFDDIARTKNVMTVLSSDDAAYVGAIDALRAGKCLYASYLYYDEINEERVTSGQWIESAAADGNSFGMAIARLGCPETVQERVKGAILAMRDAQRYPIFAMDFYSDMLYIDHVISDQPCFMAISADGEIGTYEKRGGCGVFLRDAPLKEIIRKTMPRRH